MTPTDGPTAFSTSRRAFLQAAGAGSVAAMLGGCDGDALERLLGMAELESFAVPGRDDIDDVAHLINRATWGPAPGLYAQVGREGTAAWLERQLDPASIPDGRADRAVASIDSLHESTAEMYDRNPDELRLDLMRYKLLRGVYSERQLFEVMVDVWTDHLNIVTEKGDCRWLKAADDRDVIRVHALGCFRDLIRASATSPAMLIYLDGHDNKVTGPDDRPNENYARELLELHTLGVDGGYTQGDVAEVARCLSGWTYENAPFRLRGARVGFDPGRHDPGAKRVLGHDIPAGGGADDLERVLDIVCDHPSTHRYVATRLCRRFIADPAPEDAVRAVAAAFRTSGGDIPAMLRALFATDAFSASRGVLVKRPLRFVLSALRATAADTNASPAVVAALERMGHAPFQYPTPDGYPIEAAPWLGTLLWRWNFAVDLTRSRLAGTSADVDALRAACGDDDRLAAHLLGRRPTEVERAAVGSGPDGLALVLAGPAFQRH